MNGCDKLYWENDTRYATIYRRILMQYDREIDRIPYKCSTAKRFYSPLMGDDDLSARVELQYLFHVSLNFLNFSLS